jgi:hypothetical protein
MGSVVRLTIVLPDDRSAAELLERLGVEPVDRDAVLAARPDPISVEPMYREMLDTMGEPPEWGGWPANSDRFLYVWLCLAVVPHVRSYHLSRGVPDDISWASLAHLGAELRTSRLITGAPGLDAAWDLPRIFRGTGYRLGRLSFERGGSELNTHIPGDAGPLDSGSVDDAFSQARVFFPRHFPETVAGFCCHSWLMDDQLAAYLPATSNILAFQRRFGVFDDVERADWAPLEHVFHRRFPGPDVPAALLDELPQDTVLQRAIVTHLRNGGHWYNRTGRLAF